MKKILIATDFPDNAWHAADYGCGIAKLLKAGILLCNAFIVPAEVPQDAIVWPRYEYDELLKINTSMLRRIVEELQKKYNEDGVVLNAEYHSAVGAVTQVISDVTGKGDIEMTVMSTHSTDVLNTLLVGNHSRQMIDASMVPLLLVPPNAPFKCIRKIAFATDLSNIERDLEAISKLIPLLKRFNAELLLTHVYNDNHPKVKFEKHVEQMLVELSNKADYPAIYYRPINSNKAECGLNWLCDHGHVDILAMVHRKHSFFDRVVNGSYTKRMAGRTSVPLLVIPENKLH